MENLLAGQAIKINLKRRKFKRFIRKNKLKLIIGTISFSLLSIYSILMYQFVNLIKNLKFI